MKKTVNHKLLNQWIEQNGEHVAIARIIEGTGIKPGTLEKMTSGKYPSEPEFLFRLKLAEITKLDEGRLFPAVAAKGRAS